MATLWAREFYEELHRINLPHLGPYLHEQEVTDAQAQAFQQLYDRYKNDLTALYASIKLEKATPTQAVVNVESPWHAYLFLERLHREQIRVNNVADQTPTLYLAPAYRGQAREDYVPTPSFYRTDTERAAELNKLAMFSYVFNHP